MKRKYHDYSDKHLMFARGLFSGLFLREKLETLAFHQALVDCIEKEAKNG